MPIEWPADGNMIEWVFSMRKLVSFVESENFRSKARFEFEDEDEDGWMRVGRRRVKVGAGHQTYAEDAMEVLERLWGLWWRTVKGRVPIVRKRMLFGEEVVTWKEENGESGMYFEAPGRLMEDARRFFEGDGFSRDGVSPFGAV